MISLDLPSSLERQFWDIVKGRYDGDPSAAMKALLSLHDKYGWKEQLAKDVQSIRSEVRKQGGISATKIEDAVERYRKGLNESGD
ncbi:MAG TPA: hypothetical protein VGA99_09500 [bacterium]